jgi:hypothetical protein
LDENTLLINQFSRISVWDISDPTDIKQLQLFEHDGIDFNAGRLCEDKFYLWNYYGGKEVKVFDVSCPRNIKPEHTLYLQDLVKILVRSYDGRLFAIAKEGIVEIIAGGKFKLLAPIPEDKYLMSYPSGIAVQGDLLCATGMHAGFFLYRLSGDGAIPLAHLGFGSSFCSNQIHFTADGKFVVLGHTDWTDIIDIQNPQKPKKMKSKDIPIKMKEIDYCGNFVRDGDNIITFDVEGRDDKPVVYIKEFGEKGAEVKAKIPVPEFTFKTSGGDIAIGVIRKDNYLFLLSRGRYLGVFEIE